VHHHGDRPRKNTRQTINLPTVGRKVAKVDHAADHREHEHVHPLEALPDLGELSEEVGVVLLLGRCAPAHVDGEHVRANGQKDVERDTTKEYHEEWHPLEVLEESAKERGFANSVPHDSETDVGQAVEHDEQDDENWHRLVKDLLYVAMELTLPRFNVVFVEITIEPSNEEIIETSEGNSGGDGVV
jgi:hypothetical protein